MFKQIDIRLQNEMKALAPQSMTIKIVAPPEQILRLDWWIHLGFSVHLRGNVGDEGRIRRVWPFDCPPKVHINATQHREPLPPILCTIRALWKSPRSLTLAQHLFCFRAL